MDASPLEEMIGKRLPVLDDGFVRVVDYMGGDSAIVQAARISYGEGTKRVQEDRALIRYLMRHRHTTPFEMCEIKFHVRVPMDTWRQWIRHRTANVNEYSTRYSVAIAATQRTAPDEWRLQSARTKQGSDRRAGQDVGAQLTIGEAKLHELARQEYEVRLSHGVAREQARKDLPLSTYTEAYWKIDLHNLFHFLELRMAPNAQEEIRAYAEVIGHQVVSRWCPSSWQAFLDYRLRAMTLTAIETDIVASLTAGRHRDAISVAATAGWCDANGASSSRNREREECEGKLQRLSLPTPWTK